MGRLLSCRLFLFVVTRCFSLLDVALSLVVMITIRVCFLLSRGTSRFFGLSRSVVVVVVVGGDCRAVGHLYFFLLFPAWPCFLHLVGLPSSFFLVVGLHVGFLFLCFCPDSFCRGDRNALPSFAPGGGGGQKGGGENKRERRWVAMSDAIRLLPSLLSFPW